MKWNQTEGVFWMMVPALIILMLPAILHGQVINQVSIKEAIEREYSDTSKIDDIILSGAADPYVFYDSYTEMQLVQNGLFAGHRQLGLESIYRHPGSVYFLNAYAGVLFGEGFNSDFRTAVAGFSMGREFVLNESALRSGNTRTEFYFRASPGMALAGSGFFRDRDPDLYFGLTATGILGAQFRISSRTSFFLHGGGRAYWFPALDEIGFMGAPMVSLGFQFSTSPQLPMVRY
jgi:hypothetical protein